MRKITIVLFMISICLLPGMVTATSLRFASDAATIALQQKQVVTLILDSEGQDINAIEGTITVTGSSLKLLSVVDSNSLVSYWLEYPKIVGNSIRFSGIIPGGYHGKQGALFAVLVQGDTAGDSIWQTISTKALSNDGKGTQLTLASTALTLSVNGDITISPSTAVPYSDDREAPESFKPEIGRNHYMFNNDWFVAFTTQDKSSGMDYWEIQESRTGYLDPKKWQRVESPYRLQDQSLTSSIYVRAFDHEGNVRQEIIAPLHAPSWYSDFRIYIILIVFVALALFFAYRRRHHA